MLEMSKLTEAEARIIARETAVALSAELPAWLCNEDLILLSIANALHLPWTRSVAERLRDEHRRSVHGGTAGHDDCEYCGFMDASLYRATTGRSLTDDMNLKPAKANA